VAIQKSLPCKENPDSLISKREISFRRICHAKEELLMPSILVVAPTDTRRRLVDVLLQAGYSVAEADSGEGALESVGSISPDLILMAIVMPDTNGLEVAARLRRNLHSVSVPIILLGSITPIGINDEPLASLISGYLDINVSPGELLKMVRSKLA
jgi:CheY-like chemotaxis protein